LRLKKQLVIRDHRNRPTGRSHAVGEVWVVTGDACENTPGNLWLRQPDGGMHSWSDDQSVFEFFELLQPAIKT